jgi:hypothetical protein
MYLNQDLYIVPEDIYRMGNSSTPKLSHIRFDEVNLINIGGITHVLANNRGISLYTKEQLDKESLTGWAWLMPKDMDINNYIGYKTNYKLKLWSDKPGHYMIVPIQSMPLSLYKGYLEALATGLTKAHKKS